MGGAPLSLIPTSVAIFEALEVSCARDRAFWMLECGNLGELVDERRACINSTG